MTTSGRALFIAPAFPRYAASRVSGFSRIVHVLNTTTSASSGLGASPSPRDSSMPLMRSESCAFIWQPNVVTWYRRIAVEGYPAAATRPSTRLKRARLLRHLDRPALADDDHFDLPRVLELILDLTCDLVREQHGAVVVHLGGLDDHPDLATRLKRVRLR